MSEGSRRRRCSRPPITSPGNLGHRHRHGPRRQTRAERLRIDVKSLGSSLRSHDYPYAEGTRRRLPARRHLWIRAERQRNDPARASRRVINAVRDFFNSRDFIPDRRPLHAGRLRVRPRFLPRQYFRFRRRTSRKAASCISGPRRWRWTRLLRSARRSAQKSKTRRHLCRVLDGRARSKACTGLDDDGPRRGSGRLNRLASSTNASRN